MTTPAPRGGQGSIGWLAGSLLVTGAVLTAGDLLLAYLLTSGTRAQWLWSLLALTPWGPIALVIGILVYRHRRRTQRILATGVKGRAIVRSIGSTGSVVNGRSVLRLAVSVTVPGQPAHDTTVRNAPPAHLVGMLRPGVSLPVIADRDDPGRIVIDWACAERETSPGHANEF